MKARFIGDPNDQFGGPAQTEWLGYSFPKDEWVEVADEAGAKIAGHSHFEVHGGPLDHDGDGKKGGSLKKADVIAKLEAMGVIHDPAAPVKELRELLEIAEEVQSPASEDEPVSE